MKTLIDIDEQLLDKAQKAVGLDTKKEVVTFALRELLRAKKRRELARMIGRYYHGMSLKKLLSLRSRS